VSNDQSPPARKVVPYKKGGQRRSPFADMAFQFSGTALDVAIQQREEDVEDNAAEAAAVPDLAIPEEGPGGGMAMAPQVEASEVVKEDTPEAPRHPPETAEPEASPAPVAVAAAQPRRKRPPATAVRLVADEQGGPGTPGTSDDHLHAFITRWKPFLTETQLGICAYVYNNSAASGREYCFTSTAKLMAAVSKTERQVKTVLNQLTDWGFLVKGETVVNAPREQRGTYYKLAVTKS
jgi:hypothetical protein